MVMEPKIPAVAIVDDEACVREALASLMRSAGFRAETFASAAAFLTAADREGADCLILDVRMPEVGGLELQRRLAQSGSLIPIVFITARANDEEERRARAAGAVDFLRKPFGEDVLLGAVRRAIGAARNGRGAGGHP